MLRKSLSKGFTLIEIAVVLIVVGLLIGGVLKGMELYDNSKGMSTVSQADKIKKAFKTFQDAYYTYPGDLLNASDIATCTAGTFCGNNGDGNLIVGVEVDGATNLNATVFRQNLGTPVENLVAWSQLAAAGMLNETSVTPANNVWGDSNPAAPAGGGFHVLFNGTGMHTQLGLASPLRSGHWVIQTANARANTGNMGVGGAFTVQQMARLDKKVDDGMPNAGGVIGYPSDDCATGNAANSTYVENGPLKCNMMYFLFE